MQKFMRIIVFYDLPVVKVENRKEYQKFHNYLINEGFDMLQYSIYSRMCRGLDNSRVIVKKLKENLPPKGAVRMLKITEKQYEKMEFLVGDPTENEIHLDTNPMTLF